MKCTGNKRLDLEVLILVHNMHANKVSSLTIFIQITNISDNHFQGQNRIEHIGKLTSDYLSNGEDRANIAIAMIREVAYGLAITFDLGPS